MACDLGDHHPDSVDVAPAPFLARLERANDRVRGGLGVGGRVPVRGIVATPDVAALETDPQMEPLVSGREALLAAVGRVGQASDSNVFAMRACAGLTHLASF